MSTHQSDAVASTTSTMPTPEAPPRLQSQQSLPAVPPAIDIILVVDEPCMNVSRTVYDQAMRREGILIAQDLNDLAAEPAFSAASSTSSVSLLRWHTSFHLLATFALMGIKPSHATRCAHQCMQQATRLKRKHATPVQSMPVANANSAASSSGDQPSFAANSSSASTTASSPASFDVISVPLSFGSTPLPASTCVIILHSCFTSLVHAALLRCIKNSNSSHQVLYGMCREITERRRGLIILLAGTSGTGKSTLASLLAERLKITTVLSTDSVRHALRGQFSKEEYPHLHVSTYETDQMYNHSTTSAAIAPTNGSIPSPSSNSSSFSSLPGSSNASSIGASSSTNGSSSSTAGSSSIHPETWSLKKKVLHGYKSQSHMVLAHLGKLLRDYSARNQTIIVEGVHLLPKVIVEYMTNLPGCIPFFIFISNEVRRLELLSIQA
jgi:energy-coupling factor transporter ATP-binding protein EcfA2